MATMSTVAYYISQQFLGICPSDKVPTSENPLLCRCPAGSIQALSDRCAICKVGEVPNEDQTACVGMFEKLTEICLTALFHAWVVWAR